MNTEFSSTVTLETIFITNFNVNISMFVYFTAAWKVPINITQESYEKFKASPPPKRLKRKIDRNSTDAEQENKAARLAEELESVEVTNPEPPDEDKKPMVLFSSINSSELARVSLLCLCMF